VKSEPRNYLTVVKAMTNDGRAQRILVVIDEYTRECLALWVARRLGSLQVIDTLADVQTRPGAKTDKRLTHSHRDKYTRVDPIRVGRKPVFHFRWREQWT
jgi:hypothetical protein